MLKVQYGWERQNLDQLEAITPSASVPTTPVYPTKSNRRRRLSSHSDAAERYLMSPAGHAGSHQIPHLLQDLSDIARSTWVEPSAAAARGNFQGPSLAPAAPISANRPSRRSISSRVPPPLTTVGVAPTTPVRSGILRMPSQQAEKDAVDTLLFMSSPNNSANMKYASAGGLATSPLRNEFPPHAKRVAFESPGHR